MRVCVMIQLGGTVSIDRIREDVPRLLEIAKSASKGEFEQVFRSANADLFGWFLHVPDDELHLLKERFVGSTAFRNQDSILVLELGPWFTGKGFSRAWTWLQRHRS